MGLKWNLIFSLFGDSICVGARQVHVCTKHTISSEIVLLVSVQDRCIVCTKRTIGIEIILDAPDGTHR
jgi:hypothetical protein